MGNRQQRCDEKNGKTGAGAGSPRISATADGGRPAWYGKPAEDAEADARKQPADERGHGEILHAAAAALCESDARVAGHGKGAPCGGGRPGGLDAENGGLRPPVVTRIHAATGGQRGRAVGAGGGLECGSILCGTVPFSAGFWPAPGGTGRRYAVVSGVDGTLQALPGPFCQDRSNNVHAMATLLSMRLLPDEVVVWLGRTPAALDTLLNQIQGENRPACVVSQIISEAVRFAGGVPQEPQRRTSSDIQFAPGTAVVDVVAGSASGDVGNVLTSLGSALDESPAVDTVVSPMVTPVVAVPDNQEAKAVGDAMALMEFNTSESQVTEAENIPQPGDLVVVKAGEETARISDKKDKQKNCGEQFWRWLSDGIRSGSLSVNAPDSLVHITGGMIFIPTPEIFFAFLKKTPCSSPDINRDDIQREFEKLGRNFCKRDKSLFQCMKYEEERRQGRHKRWSGYLIMARKIYTDRDIPDDSMYLFVSMGG